MVYQHQAPNQCKFNDERSSNLQFYKLYQDFHLPAKTYNLPNSLEFLFQEEFIAQRHSWGEILTYYTGIGYLYGATVDAAKGLVSGVKAIELTDTLKLKVNWILNGSGHTGRQIGNRCGVIELMYARLESGMVAIRDTDDIINSVVAGLATGAIYRASAGPRSAAVARMIGGMLVGIVVTEKQALK